MTDRTTLPQGDAAQRPLDPRDAHERRRRERFGAHDCAGGDHAGDGLSITIRIGPDGRVYFQDITGAMLPVVDVLRGIDAAQKPAPEPANEPAQPAQPQEPQA